jgi:sugar (pentulose or hexulose) kinase
MAHSRNYLALDLGAESGRAILGQFDGQRLKLAEVHRFTNSPVVLPVKALPDTPSAGKVSLQWDILRQLSEIKKGLSLAAGKYGQDLASIGIDSWGVDFGLLDREGVLISNPYHYRDSRTDGMLEEAFRRVPRAEIYERTGIQFLTLNSLYQLLSMVVSGSPALNIARTFLTIPNLLNYWLTGQAVNEFTHVTTTQCYNPHLKDWDLSLLARLGIPTQIFPRIVSPGTNLGQLLPYVADEVGLGFRSDLVVIATASHDTGAAVAAVPAERPGFAWISSGTWSVVGAEWPNAIINDKSLAYNFTNEGGVCDTYRFSRNVMGLWLLQECRRTWSNRGDERSYTELIQMADQAEPFQVVIDPDDAEFFKPGDMPARIRDYCHRTGQVYPESKAQIVRCVLESLALKYRWVLERLEEMVGQSLNPIHIVGGGTQNRMLNQFTANATGKRVLTGPVEATALGNILMQAIGLNYLGSLQEGRALIRTSFPTEDFDPARREGWDEAYQKLLSVMT